MFGEADTTEETVASSWRAPAALALCAALLVGLTVGHRPAADHGAPVQGAVWAQHLHFGRTAHDASR